jgi:hypothetical protein
VPINLTVDTSSIERALGQFMGSDLRSEFIKAKEEISERVLSYARDNHNYKSRTGNLKAATKVKSNLESDQDLSIELYIDTSKATYAKQIVKGTGSRAPDPFIDEALEANKNWIYQRLQKALDDAVIKNNRRG